MIPRVIHRIWLGDFEPVWVRACRASWEREGWELRDWDDAEAQQLFPLRNQFVYDHAAEIAPDHIGQLRSDVLRYELLERFGGVYVDADMECLRPVDELIGDADLFAAWEVQDTWLNNGFMGAVPTHPFVERLIVGLRDNVSRLRGHKPNRMTGPRYLTRTYRRHDEGLLALPQSAVYPYGFDEVDEHGPGEDWGDAYCVHHWHNKRRERGVPCPTT